MAWWLISKLVFQAGIFSPLDCQRRAQSYASSGRHFEINSKHKMSNIDGKWKFKRTDASVSDGSLFECNVIERRHEDMFKSECRARALLFQLCTKLRHQKTPSQFLSLSFFNAFCSRTRLTAKPQACFRSCDRKILTLRINCFFLFSQSSWCFSLTTPVCLCTIRSHWMFLCSCRKEWYKFVLKTFRWSFV